MIRFDDLVALRTPMEKQALLRTGARSCARLIPQPFGSRLNPSAHRGQ